MLALRAKKELQALSFAASRQGVILYNTAGRLRAFGGARCLLDEYSPEEAGGPAMLRLAVGSVRSVVKNAGNGSRTALLLVLGITDACARLEASGADGQHVAAQLSELERSLSLYLRKNSLKSPELTRSAAFTASGDDEISDVVEASATASPDACIEVFKGKSTGLELDSSNLYRIPSKVLFPAVANQEFSPCAVVFCDFVVSDVAFAAELLSLPAGGRNLILFCAGCSAEVQRLFTQNYAVLSGKFSAVVIEDDPMERHEMMEDAAAGTGAVVLAAASTCDDMFGLSESVKVSSSGAVVKFDKSAAATRKSLLEKQIVSTKNKISKDKLQSRIAQLSGASVTLRVGGKTEHDAEVRYDGAVRAAHAARQAARSGVIPGGYGPFLRYVHDSNLRGPIRTALEFPFKVLHGEFLPSAEERLLSAPFNFGFDLRDKILYDVSCSGIVDPVETVISSIEAACSYGRILATATSIKEVR